MHLRRALFIAACLLPAAPAAAQAPWPGQTQPQSAEPATAPWPGQAEQQPAAQSPWPQQSTQPAAPPPQAPQAGPSPWSQPPKSEPPCIKEFVSLRSDAQKKAGAIQEATKGKKMSAREACNLFSSFSAAEAKLIKYASANASSCGIPESIIKQMKEQHTQTTGVRTNACRAAQAQQQQPQGPRTPSLSDALSAPVPSSNNIKTGRGTFDTLTGSPLGK